MGRSGILRGDAVLFHRYGTDLLQGERQLILAYDSQNHFGVEYSNLGQQSWGKIHGKEMADDAIELVVLEHSIEIKTNSQSIFFTLEVFFFTLKVFFFTLRGQKSGPEEVHIHHS